MFPSFKALLAAEVTDPAVFAATGEFTLQEAADVLNVSRAYLSDLLDQRAIPFRYTGEDRRILARDLHRYKQADDARRIACANELTAEAQKLNLGY